MTTTAFTRVQIDRLIEAGGKFLRAASQHPVIMALLIGLGYSIKAHEEGWELYLPLIGYKGMRATRPGPIVGTTEQHKALVVVDNYDEAAFKRARAALEHLYPEQAAFMFGELEAQQGVLSLGSVTTFLDRYVTLRDGKSEARKSMRKQDAKAAAELEARNIIDPALERNLRKLIETAQVLAPAPSVDDDAAQREADKQAAAAAFKVWLDDWRNTAAAGITRRDYLILLGLAKRRAKKEKKSDPSNPVA